MVLGRKPFQFLPLPKSGLHTSTYRIHLTRIWGGKGGVACDKIVTPVSGLAQPASRKPCHNDNGRAKGIPMRQKPIIPHLFFLFIFTSCRPSPSPSTASPGLPTDYAHLETSTDFRIESPQSATSPAGETLSSPVVTQTDQLISDLRTAGPYLSLTSYPHTSFTLFDLYDGGGRTFPTPEGTIGSLSPNSIWYAFMAPEWDTLYGFPDDGLLLVIQNTRTGEIRNVASLLPKDYSERIRQIEQILDNKYPPYDGETGYFISVEDIVLCLWAGFQSITWSPDGRYLIFPAITDGYSSSLFLYDLDQGYVKKVIAADYIISDLSWSPDGEWIHFDDTVPMQTYWPTTVRLIRRDGTLGRKIFGKGLTFGIGEWISDTEFFTYGCQDGGGCHDLMLNNTQTGRQTEIWTRLFQEIVVDKRSKTIAITVGEACDHAPDICVSEDELGIYFGSVNGNLSRSSNPLGGQLKSRGGLIHPFIGIDYDQVFGITPEGRFDLLQEGKDFSFDVSLSRWLVLFNDKGLWVFNPSDHFQFQINRQSILSAIWDTNSRGVYFMTDGEIYYLPIETQTPERVVACRNICRIGARLSLINSVFLQYLPDLRAQPTREEKPDEVKSIWMLTKFEDIFMPGTNEYAVTLPAYSEWRWDFSWCAKTQAGLEAILAPVDIRFDIGGELLGEDIFRIYDSAKGGGYCRNWATLFSGWQPGDETDLTIRYTLHEAVNDGTREYPPGEYRQIMHITVT
jgi:WD40 repeat protein